jgi:hypothetical protein
MNGYDPRVVAGNGGHMSAATLDRSKKDPAEQSDRFAAKRAFAAANAEVSVCENAALARAASEALAARRRSEKPTKA